MTDTDLRPDATDELTQALRERVLVMDGAMGTMIQRQGLSEDDFRGERFADWDSDLQGNNDLLVLTQPELITDLHRQYLEAAPSSSRPTPSTRSASRWPTTAWRTSRVR